MLPRRLRIFCLKPVFDTVQTSIAASRCFISVTASCRSYLGTASQCIGILYSVAEAMTFCKQTITKIYQNLQKNQLD